MRADQLRSTLENFWLKVQRADGDACWTWTGAVLPFGHGYFAWRRHGPKRNVYAHRVMWILAHGEIPAGLDVLHRCDVPACVNPAHLFIGTRADNNRDMREKRRHRFGSRHWNARLTEADAGEVKRLLRSGHTQLDIARRFGVSRGTVLAIHRGTTWAHVTEAPLCHA